jgi:Flp pilus assembly protein TadG
MRRMRAAFGRLRGDERGMEAAAMIFVLPFLFILVLGLIDIGWMIKTRMVVENITRDAARHAAFDGGNYNPRTNTEGREWDDVAMRSLWNGGGCVQSGCTSAPIVDCTRITKPNGTVYRSHVVQDAGDIITCTVNYKYKPINGPLMNSPLGLGIGSMLDPFVISTSARSEVGSSGR